MYADRYGLDWESLSDFDQVVERAYALGVASYLGESHPEELERLATQLESAYERSFVVLAYQEGREDVASSSVDDIDASDAERERTWERFVTEPDAYGPDRLGSDAERRPASSQTALPEALARVSIDSRPADSTDRVRRPSFLEGGRSGRSSSESERDER